MSSGRSSSGSAGAGGAGSQSGAVAGQQAVQPGGSGGFVSATGAEVGELSAAALALLAAGLLFSRLGRRHYRAAHRA